jgi:pSer/pThr/pTyr-binding forkhead associated (FHA) protein
VQQRTIEVEVSDGLETKRYSFAAGQPILIGRGRQCHVPLDSNKVARVQCTVNAEAGGLGIVDQGSGCGTFLNGRRINRAYLHEADQVLIADLQLRFRVASAVPCSGTVDSPVA